jgi:hypothetical protein
MARLRAWQHWEVKDKAIIMTLLTIEGGPFKFAGRLEEAAAPKTCAAFKRLLPYHQKIIHVRWSGEACWIPLGDLDLGLGYENHTSHPGPGDVILYPGGISETEILLAYGGVSFASKVGQLAGNHFLTITEGRENLAALGKLVLWEGAKDIRFELRR